MKKEALKNIQKRKINEGVKERFSKNSPEQVKLSAWNFQEEIKSIQRWLKFIRYMDIIIWLLFIGILRNLFRGGAEINHFIIAGILCLVLAITSFCFSSKLKKRKLAIQDQALDEGYEL